MDNYFSVNSKRIWLYATIVASLLSSCASSNEASSNKFAEPTIIPLSISPTEAPIMPSPEPTQAPSQVPFIMNIAEFPQGEIIPAEFACTGENKSPAISWSTPPVGSKSLALLFDDPDAPGGSWVHWILFNIPVDESGLEAGILTEAIYANGMQSGANSWGEIDYSGPCPPEGSTHEYLFILYALDSLLEIDSGASKAKLLSAIEGHVLVESRYTALFSR